MFTYSTQPRRAIRKDDPLPVSDRAGRDIAPQLRSRLNARLDRLARQRYLKMKLSLGAGFIGLMILAVGLFVRSIHFEITTGLPVSTPTPRPIISVTPAPTETSMPVSMLATHVVSTTPTPAPATPPAANLPECLTYNDVIEIQRAAQGEGIGLHNPGALYFLMAQMLMDKQRTTCEPLYRWTGRDNPQAVKPIGQSVMDAWAKASADYPAYDFGYCAQIGSIEDYNNIWLPQRVAGKLPRLKLGRVFGSADGSSAILAFNCAEIGK